MKFSDIDYLVRALNNLKIPCTVSDALSFETQIAYKEYTLYHKEDDGLPMCREYKNFLIALAGPHAKAILKAHRIQHGLESKENYDL